MNSTAGYVTRAEGLAAARYQIQPEVPWLTPTEFLERSREEQWTIVDVRTPPERGVSIIPGAVSKEVFEAHLDEYAKTPIWSIAPPVVAVVSTLRSCARGD